VSNAIVIEGVTKTFGAKVAVRDLSLTVPAGSLTGFIGPNGAGKTTTIRMVMSILFPDRGNISVLGKPSAVESKDRIGYLPEERGVYRTMKVVDFLAYMGKLKGLDGAVARARSLEWLGRVGLGDAARKKCQELSKGMQQKVQFIASVMHEPELLILDEVFSGLDPLNRRLMRDLIDEQHARGRTIVFSTHAMFEAEQLCDHLFMIHNGKKVLDAPMNDLRALMDPRTLVVEPDTEDASYLQRVPGVDFVRKSPTKGGGWEVRVRDGEEIHAAMARVVAAGPVRRIEIKRVGLDDVFVKLVEATGEKPPNLSELTREAPGEGGEGGEGAAGEGAPAAEVTRA
jgi:ABC-2 type transport system ATP-binding protein